MRGSRVKLAALVGAVLATLQASSFAANPTIYFTAGGTPPAGTQLTSGTGMHQGTFSNQSAGANIATVTGSNGIYMPAFVTSINSGAGDTTDYLAIAGFNPSTDNIYVALKFDNSGTAISPSNTALLDEIDTAINGNTGNPNYSGPLAQNIAGSPFASVFPGFDIYLSFPETFTPGGTRVAASASAPQFDVGYDFSTYTDAGIAAGGITVTDIGVVPEPASIGLLAAGGLALLARRRRNRA